MNLVAASHLRGALGFVAGGRTGFALSIPGVVGPMVGVFRLRGRSGA